MSLVSRPCKYEARSVPDTTIRPRSERSRNAARWRAASYASTETAGIMVLCCGMLSLHSIRAALAALTIALPLSAFAQEPAPVPQLQEAGATTFTVFLRGAPIGTEQIAIARTAT